jgi:hypothetical protein
MKKSFLVILLLFSAFLIAQTDKDKCGTERWSIKTLTDDKASQVNFNNAVSSTVYKQTKFEPVEVDENTPRLDVEKTVYKIKCYLIEYKTEDDRDYHLVIKDEKRKVTMVAEICDPTCPGIKNSIAYDKFVDVRKKFEGYFKKKSMKKIKVHIQIEGVGFFDKKHPVPPVGNAKNNREIHPITKLIFLK